MVPLVTRSKLLEVAAALPLMSAWADKVDFFAIGTNDLTASALGLDRDDPVVAGLSNALHPGVLRLIHGAVQDAHAGGRPVSVCGEVAADPLGTVALAVLGVDSISVPVNQFAATRRVLAGLGSTTPRTWPRRPSVAMGQPAPTSPSRRRTWP
jgi:phosphotransferase system, enzyme I, PtsP